MKTFSALTKIFWKIEIELFPLVRYFTWKLNIVSNILWMIAKSTMNIFFQKSLTIFLKKATAWFFSGPYFPVFGLNTGKYGPEKTPYLDTFYTVSCDIGVRVGSKCASEISWFPSCKVLFIYFSCQIQKTSTIYKAMFTRFTNFFFICRKKPKGQSVWT